MPKPAALTEARPEPDRVLAARERQQRYRQRRRDGLVTLSVTLDEVALAEKLVEAGYLPALRGVGLAVAPMGRRSY